MARIGIDIDGVCYGFSEAFCRNVGWDPLKVDKWEFFKDHGMDLKTFLKMCRSMIVTGKLFRYGDVLDGTVEALQTLSREGHYLYFVTDRAALAGDDLYLKETIKIYTERWLEDNFIPWHNVYYTGDKATKAKELGLDFFLDDKIENYDSLEGVVKGNYLFDRPWNQRNDLWNEPNRVRSWSEFVREVVRAEKPKLQQLMNETGVFSGGMTGKMNLPKGEVRVTSTTGGQKGQKQARMGSLDPWALLQVGEVAGFGEEKYERLNYMKGYDWNLNYDAMQRHLGLFWSGVDLDEESGLPHLAHAAWHCLALLAFGHHGLGTDTRYRKDAA